MNDSLQTKLIEYLNNIDAFVYEQVPDVFQQFIIYEGVESISLAFIFLIISLIAVVTFVKSYKKARNEIEKDRGDPVVWLFLAIITGSGAIGFFAGSLVKLKCTALVYFAPKVYLLKMFLSSRS